RRKIVKKITGNDHEVCSLVISNLRNLVEHFFLFVEPGVSLELFAHMPVCCMKYPHADYCSVISPIFSSSLSCFRQGYSSLKYMLRLNWRHIFWAYTSTSPVFSYMAIYFSLQGRSGLANST